MKTKQILLPLLVFVLGACNLVVPNPYESSGNSSTPSTNTSTGNQSSNPGTSSNTTSSDNSSNTSSENNTTPVTPLKKMSLGDYGDYVEYVGSKDLINVQEEYERLSQKIIGEVNGIFQTSYKQGLLDFFNIENEIKLNIIISKTELNKLNDDHYKENRESYRICDVEIKYNDFLFHYENVGIRQKGNTSRGEILSDDKINLRHYKLNLAETFDDEFRGDKVTLTNDEELYRKDRDFFGLEKIDIRWNRNGDGTYLKEYYAFETYRRNGVLAPRTNPVNMFMTVDGSKQNMGVYLAVEDIGKAFIKRNLISTSAGGDLYKLGWGSGVGAMFNDASNNLYGVEEQVKDGSNFRQIGYTYDLKTNKKTSTHSDLINFINGVKNTSASSFDTFLKNNTEYDYFNKYNAIAYLLGDPDDLRGNANNAYIYFTADTKKALIIPTDNDRVLGSAGGSNPTGHYGTKTNPFDKKTGYGNTPLLIEKSITNNGNSTVKNDYIEAIKEVVNNGTFTFADFEAKYNHAVQNYQDDLTLGSKVNHDTIPFNIYENNNVSSSSNLSASVYFETKINTFKKAIGEPTDGNNQNENQGTVPANNYYFIGDHNSWGFLSENILVKNQDGTYSIEKYIEAQTRIKISSYNWSGIEYNYLNVENPNNSLFENSKNNAIKFLQSGTYILTLTSSNTMKIEKK